MVVGMRTPLLSSLLAAACASVVAAPAAVAGERPVPPDDVRPPAVVAPAGPAVKVGLRSPIVAIPKPVLVDVSSLGEQDGLLLRPVPGGIGSAYGLRMHPILHYVRLHAGVDLSAACGQPVAAAAPGRVTFAGWGSGSGWRVEIDHGVIGGHPLATVYSHLSHIAVRPGEQVGRGQGVGRVGTTGLSTGCHLHFETRVAGVPVDPAPFLSTRSPQVVVVRDLPQPVRPAPRLPAPNPSPKPSNPLEPAVAAPTKPVRPSPSVSASPNLSPSPSPSVSASPEPPPPAP